MTPDCGEIEKKEGKYETTNKRKLGSRREGERANQWRLQITLSHRGGGGGEFLKYTLRFFSGGSCFFPNEIAGQRRFCIFSALFLRPA